MGNITASPTGLYWSTRGHIVCRDHADEILDSRWAAEGWSVLPASSQGFRGMRYQCEKCAPDNRVIVRRTRVAPSENSPTA